MTAATVPTQQCQRGRPRTKGARLGTPVQLAAKVPANKWATATIDCRAKTVDALVWSRPVLWYDVERDHMVLLVVVRDPTGRQPDDFFVCSDPNADGTWVASHYSGRWSIEIVFRDAKQILGAENPQSWKGIGPERAAGLSLWLMTAIWAWYIPTFAAAPTWTDRPWYRAKTTPSFLDALAALRRILWQDRITAMSASPLDSPKIVDALLDVLATAARSPSHQGIHTTSARSPHATTLRKSTGCDPGASSSVGPKAERNQRSEPRTRERLSITRNGVFQLVVFRLDG